MYVHDIVSCMSMMYVHDLCPWCSLMIYRYGYRHVNIGLNHVKSFHFMSVLINFKALLLTMVRCLETKLPTNLIMFWTISLWCMYMLTAVMCIYSAYTVAVRVCIQPSVYTSTYILISIHKLVLFRPSMQSSYSIQ